MHYRQEEQNVELSVPFSFTLSGGEVHFLWWFIQGSIMSPSTRKQLWDGWGMCERHAWGFISVEAAFRQGYMHGPAILYEDLMHRALIMFSPQGPLKRRRVRRGIRERGPCLMCDCGYGPNSKGSAASDLVARGRDPGELLALANVTSPYWREAVCGECGASGSSRRCRRHLIEDIHSGRTVDLSTHERFVRYIHSHIETYAVSFRHGYHGTETIEDIAALISAVGWCSGWKHFLSILQ